MNAGADRILSDRTRALEAPAPLGSLAIAAALHGALLLGALLLPRLAPPPKPLEFVPVTVVPAAALGVRNPRPPAPSTSRAEPSPSPAEPPPAPTKKEAPVLPVKPEPRPEPAPKPVVAQAVKKPNAPSATAPTTSGRTSPGPTSARPGTVLPQARPGEEDGRKGSPTGTPLGTASMGSEIAGLDNPDFTYGYYINQLLEAIDAQWVRPAAGDRIRAILSFRIHRDGSITEIAVKEPSGSNAFDLAALRAVRNAAPFPPLPRAYRHDSLGVNLIVR